MKHSHTLSQGQRKALAPLLQQRQAVEAQIRMVMGIAIEDAGLPPVEGGWTLNVETMALEGEVTAEGARILNGSISNKAVTDGVADN